MAYEFDGGIKSFKQVTITPSGPDDTAFKLVDPATKLSVMILSPTGSSSMVFGTAATHVKGMIWSQPVFTDATTGVSPSYKALYGNVTCNAGVTGGTQYFKAVQGLTTVGNGAVAPAEVWGTYGIVNSGATWSGTLLGAWPCVGELSLDGTGTFGPNQANSFMSAGYFHSWVEDTVTMAATAPIDAPLIGDINMATGRRKADAAVAAVINGAINQSTAGAGAAFKVYDFTAGDPGFDYGLDLSFSSGSYANVFEQADIRFSSGGLFVTLTSAITAGVTATTTAAGTLGKTTNATGRASLFVSDGSNWQFLTNA